jgi:hypothetical protein|tara:strand:- start:15 stop:224 length:210 start_codon:yes stop_codon:yes gene_type:complete
MDITIDYLKSKGFNCESIREQYKGDFKLNLNRYGEYIYGYKELGGVIDIKLDNTKELEDMYYEVTRQKL